MSDSPQSVPVFPLLATIIVIAACTSVLWMFFWQQHDQMREQQLQSLTAEAEQRREREAHLQEQYIAAEDARQRSEQALARLQDQDWQGRYQAAAAENDQLTEQLAELELRHTLIQDRLETELTLLLGRHTELEETYAELESRHAELAMAHATLEDTLSSRSDLEQAHRQLQLDYQAAQDKLQALTEQHQALESSLADSRLEPQRPPTEHDQAAVIQHSVEQTRAAPATSTSSGTTPGYRLVRLQSLGSTMQGRSSDERRSILTTVIPTIPNGIDGGELAELVAGMDSSHIREVIQATRQYINTPLDPASLDIISTQLDDTDTPGVLDLLQ